MRTSSILDCPFNCMCCLMA